MISISSPIPTKAAAIVFISSLLILSIQALLRTKNMINGVELTYKTGLMKPKIKLRTILTIMTKDTLIPAREILSAKTKISIWDVTWESM